MDVPTRNLSRYILDMGINLTKLAEKTGIPYPTLYDSLGHKSRDRDLRAGEFIAICTTLKKDPMDFAEDEKEVV